MPDSLRREERISAYRAYFGRHMLNDEDIRCPMEDVDDLLGLVLTRTTLDATVHIGLLAGTE